jgi:HicB family
MLDALLYTQLFTRVDWPTPPRHPVPRPVPTARLSLRVPKALKRRVEASAELEGVAPNEWVVRALSRSVDPRLTAS